MSTEADVRAKMAQLDEAAFARGVRPVPVVTAYVSVVDVYDDHGNRIREGAYSSKTKFPVPIPFCDAHGRRVGWWMAWKWDSFGLRLKGYLDLDLPGADFVYSQFEAKRGGFSVAIKYRADDASLTLTRFGGHLTI